MCEFEYIRHRPHATIVGAERDFTLVSNAVLVETCANPCPPSLMTRVQARLNSSRFVLKRIVLSLPIICANIDDCACYACGPVGTCVDGQEDYSCFCLEGFEETVVLAEKICGNMDDCHGVLCGASGTCNDLVSSFECQCGPGHEHEVAQDASGVRTGPFSVLRMQKGQQG